MRCSSFRQSAAQRSTRLLSRRSEDKLDIPPVRPVEQLSVTFSVKPSRFTALPESKERKERLLSNAHGPLVCRPEAAKKEEEMCRKLLLILKNSN